MVTLEDIAIICGVSPSSVSRALNNHSEISEEKKKMICEVAEKMGYRNKAVERSRVRTFLVGLLVTEDAKLFTSDLLIMEIRRCLSDKGYDLVLLSSADRAVKKDISRPGVLYRARFFELEGIFLFSNIKEADFFQKQEYMSLRSLAHGEIPVVTIGSGLSSWGCVVPDYDAGLECIFRMIYRSGHRRIALVYGRYGGSVYNQEKRIMSMAQEIGLDLSSDNICCVAQEDGEGAFSAVAALLRKVEGIRPTCLVFGDDLLMQGGMAAVCRMGLSVPDDLSVVSMRALDYNGHSDKALTCWDLNLHEIASDAVEMMLREIEFPGSATRQTRLVKGRMKEGDTLKAIKTDLC